MDNNFNEKIVPEFAARWYVALCNTKRGFKKCRIKKFKFNIIAIFVNHLIHILCITFTTAVSNTSVGM